MNIPLLGVGGTLTPGVNGGRSAPSPAGGVGGPWRAFALHRQPEENIGHSVINRLLRKLSRSPFSRKNLYGIGNFGSPESKARVSFSVRRSRHPSVRPTVRLNVQVLF